MAGCAVQISELATTSAVPLATVKFYLREGLLQPGRPTSATRSEYDDAHVARLRLIRALVEVAGLPLAAVRAVLAAADGAAGSLLQAIGVAQDALPPTTAEGTDTARALALVEDLGWRIDPGCAAVRQLAVAIASLDAAGADSTSGTLAEYGRAVAGLAEREVAEVPRTSQEEAVRYVVVGTLFYEPVLLALRRLAQQDAAARTLRAL